MSLRRLVRIALFAGACAALYGCCDLIFSWNPAAAAPYHAERGDPVFRAQPWLWFGFFAETLNGWIAALGFLAIERGLTGTLLRRGLVYGLLIFGFWVVSGTMSATVWLNVPSQLLWMNVVFGLPKSLSIGIGTSYLWQTFFGKRSFVKG